jgi:hypothetical protein
MAVSAAVVVVLVELAVTQFQMVLKTQAVLVAQELILTQLG